MTAATRRMARHGLGLCAVLALTTAVRAQSYQVNISGATLFNNFFGAPQSTNDYINVDGDFRQFDPNCVSLPFSGFHLNPCDGVSFVDQLAPAFASCGVPNPADNPTRWVVNYRAVGSGNGLVEMRDYALCGYIYPTTPDPGRINSVIYWNASGDQLPGCGQGADGTPTGYARTSVDIAVMDVPLIHFVRAPGTPAWNRKPGMLGYGMNPLLSYTCCTPSGSTNMLESLTSPTCGQTLPASSTYSVPVSWVPIAVMANIGAVQGAACDGLQQNISITELDYLFLTGRMPSGENLVAATRDSGSGTRNGFCNTIGIDPSFGRGDNCGGTVPAVATNAMVGPRFRASNCFSTGQLVSVVKNSRLGVGYAGADSAKTALVAGQAEVLGVIFDDRGGTLPVRPSASTVLHPCSPNTGYQIGGNETFITVGDPFAAYPDRVPALAAYPGHEGNPAMENAEAAAYIRNITESAAQPPSDPNQALMPGQLLAKSFFLPRAFDCMQDPDNPTQWITNPNVDVALQTYIQNNNTSINVRAFGDPAYPADLTPKRAGTSDYAIVWNDPNEVCNHTTCDCAYPPNGQYSDGSTNGAYRNPYTGTYGDPLPGGYGLAGGNKLNPRNRVMGDFNGDGCRDINDIPAMMAAIYDTMILHNPAYPTYRLLANDNANNPAVPEIIGDFNADGNFDCRDVRYFCDGLALDSIDGQLHRAAAFLAVDNAWFNLTGDDNFFNTTIYDCQGNARPWVRGASAADVAGSSCVAPGAKPCGYDCRVDCTDAQYIDANFGNWANINDAVAIDLSCDLNNDRKIDAADLQAIEALMGCVCPGLVHGGCTGDMNCDGSINFADINPFVLYLSNPTAWQSAYSACPLQNGDINHDGTYPSFGDINPFVALLSQQPAPTCP